VEEVESNSFPRCSLRGRCHHLIWNTKENIPENTGWKCKGSALGDQIHYDIKLTFTTKLKTTKNIKERNISVGYTPKSELYVKRKRGQKFLQMKISIPSW